MSLFFVFVIGVTFVFARIYQNPAILYAGVVFAVFMNVFSYWNSDKLVLKMVHAVPVDLQKNPDLYKIVENLSIASGLPMPKVYVIPESAPNAFATGRDPEHAVVAITEGLLQKLNKTEIEGVIAHEMSHIGNRDMLISTVIVVLVGFISIISDMFLRNMFWGGRRRDREGGSGALILIGIIFAILAPISASLIHLAISRKREFLADASGVLLTRYPEGLASALEKISSDQTQMKTAANAMAHLYIANPFKGKKISKLFMTHPPVEERIKILREINLGR